MASLEFKPVSVYSPEELEKVGHALIYLSTHTDKPSKTKVLKLLYLLDEFSVKLRGFPMFGLTYKVWQLGPVCEEVFIDLMVSDDEFITAVERSTSSTQALHKRFDKWRERMQSILRNDVPQERLFTLEFKQRLYDADSTCTICGNAIRDLDDAAVDHIEQYWLGGTTTEDNGRLTHRYCNNARKRKEG